MDAVITKDRAVPQLSEPRARIGLIIPSVNRMTEPQFSHFAPDGLGIHVARGRIAGQPGRTIAEMSGEIAHAAETLADAKPDLIVFHCTGTSMKEGTDGEKRILDVIRKTTGLEALSTSRLVADALHALGMKKVILLTPYQSNAEIVSYLAEVGVAVVRDVALKLQDRGAVRTGDAAALARTGAGERLPRGRRRVSELHQYHPDRSRRSDRARARQAGRQQQSGGAVGLCRAPRRQARQSGAHAGTRTAHESPRRVK